MASGTGEAFTQAKTATTAKTYIEIRNLLIFVNDQTIENLQA